MPGPAKFLVRKTAAQWAAANPILGLGTFGIEVTTNQLKIGDGGTDWAALPYMASPYDMALGPTAITEQHPAEVWTNNNPILSNQTIAYESDTHKGKIGDGVTPWRELPYINGKDAVGVLLLESGAALLLEDGSLLLLAGSVVLGDGDTTTIYDVATQVTVQGSFGASLLSVVTSTINVAGSLGAAMRPGTSIPVSGSLGARPLLGTSINVTGQIATGLAGIGGYMLADAVADAVGVNVHLEYGGSIYDTAYATIVKPRLIELGTRHIRGGSGSGTARTNATTRYTDLATKHGIKLLLVNISYVAETAYVTAGLSYVEAMENRNEPDVFDNSPVDNWKAGLAGRHQTFWNAVRAIPALNGIKVLPSPMGRATQFTWLHTNFPGFVNYCDVGSLHDYANDTQKTVPEALTNGNGGGWDGFGNYYTNTQVENQYRTDLGSVKDIYSTEIGPEYTGTNASTEHIGAKAVVRHLLVRVLGFKRKRLYFYQLVEDAPTTHDFGLIKTDGTPRQAFHSLRNIVDLFYDAGPSFKTTVLGYTLTGTTSDMRWYVTQKRNGMWLLTIWRGTGVTGSIFNPVEGARITVTLALSTPISRARRYEPTLAVDMAAALKQKYLNPTSISVSVPDHPVVVELSPVYPNRSGLPWPSGMDLITDADMTQANSLATFRGRPLDCTMTFMGSGYSGAGKTWTDMTSANAVVRAGGQIDTIIRAGMRAIHAMPMCLDAERGDNARRIYLDMQTLGSAYKGYYTLMCDRIAVWATTRAQQEMIAIRIGWEADHGYPWSIHDMSSTDLPYYTRWWNAVATIVRARLPYVEIVWNHLVDAGSTTISDYTPDLDLFDTLGADCYDGNFHGYWVDSDANWNLFKGSYDTTTGYFTGVQGFVDKAREMGKMVSFDEWGAFNKDWNKDTNPTPPPDGSNNTVFVTKMYEFFSTNADIVSFENYFNGPGNHRIEPNVCQPLPRAAYLAAWTP